MISNYNKFFKEKQMRDILNLLDTILTEANLGAPEIPASSYSKVNNPATGKFFTRPELFLQKVKSKSPFTLIKGGEVVVDPAAAPDVEAWIKSGPKGPKGTIFLNTIDGGQVKNTDLLKTVEFGSKESETIKLKGSDIFDVTDQEVNERFRHYIKCRVTHLSRLPCAVEIFFTQLEVYLELLGLENTLSKCYS